MNHTEIITFYWIAFGWMSIDLKLNKRSFRIRSLKKSRNTHTIKWFGHIKTGLEIHLTIGHQTIMWIWPVVLCCVALPACLPAFCFISRWNLSRIYLAGNFDNQPCNLYFQPCENIMYKKIKIVPDITKYVTGMPFTCPHCMCILLMPLCWEVKMSNKRNHNP